MKKTFFSLFDNIVTLIDKAIYVIVALAVFGFMWGIVKILFNADNEVAKKEGRAFMLYGILTLFVMTSIWGLVNLLNGTIQVEDDGFSTDPSIDSSISGQDEFERDDALNKINEDFERDSNPSFEDDPERMDALNNN